MQNRKLVSNEKYVLTSVIIGISPNGSSGISYQIGHPVQNRGPVDSNVLSI